MAISAPREKANSQAVSMYGDLISEPLLPQQARIIDENSRRIVMALLVRHLAHNFTAALTITSLANAFVEHLDLLEISMDLTWLTHLAPVIEPTYKAYRRVRALFPPQPAPHWKERLNVMFAGHIRILAKTTVEPRITIEGKVPLTRSQKQRAKAIAERLEDDEQQAILAAEPDWNSQRIDISVRLLRYSDVLVLRETSTLLPKVLSANTLIVCRDEREIIIQRRGPPPYVKTYPNCLGTLGGGYNPAEDKDTDSLVLGAIREVWEEIRIPWIPPHPTAMIAEELTTGYLQVAFLGVNISREAREHIRPRLQEGRPVHISFDNLEEYLNIPIETTPEAGPRSATENRGWVPLGKAHILAWLAHGAPGAGWQARFGKHSAKELFSLFVAKLS